MTEPSVGGAAPGPGGPNSNNNAKLYVGRLPRNAEKRDLEDLFQKYGKVVSLDVKQGGFAFVEYEDNRDAEDAIAALNNYPFEGERISVEWSRRSANASSSTCFICGQGGHWARECPDNREQGMDVRSGKCFKCGAAAAAAAREDVPDLRQDTVAEDMTAGDMTEGMIEGMTDTTVAAGTRITVAVLPLADVMKITGVAQTEAVTHPAAATTTMNAATLTMMTEEDTTAVLRPLTEITAETGDTPLAADTMTATPTIAVDLRLLAAAGLITMAAAAPAVPAGHPEMAAPRAPRRLLVPSEGHS
ncbi:hypothetical protein BC830DRAFT_1173181 [Chytriomyces sp. MP71]|nr:hypothetical protein BC830DRAFT_1173181 [Chytriomyces sp. MP71]